jgi:hypothetical protein
MTCYGRLNLSKSPEIVGTTRGQTRTKMVRGLMAAIVIIVALAIIAEARLTPENWLANFVNCCSRD